MLSRLPSTSVNNYEPSTSKVQCRVNKLSAIVRVENNEYFPAKYIKYANITTKISGKINSKLRP